MKYEVHSLKLRAKAPENGWLEYYFPLGEGLFSGAMLVVGRVYSLIFQETNPSCLAVLLLTFFGMVKT